MSTLLINDASNCPRRRDMLEASSQRFRIAAAEYSRCADPIKHIQNNVNSRLQRRCSALRTQSLPTRHTSAEASLSRSIRHQLSKQSGVAPKGLEIPMSRKGMARNAARVTASRQHMLDRYKRHLQAAASKIAAGDRIGAENDYQHAEHFFRCAAEEKGTHRL